jgi:hypothetical protein
MAKKPKPKKSKPIQPDKFGAKEGEEEVQLSPEAKKALKKIEQE